MRCCPASFDQRKTSSATDIWRYTRQRTTILAVQSPVIVFDHITHQVATMATGPEVDKRLVDLLESQREQVATSGRPSK
jgi:hypothetical protein